MEYVKEIGLSSKEKIELNQAKDKLENLNYYNEKISFLVSEWMVDYGYDEKPDPYKAIKWGTNQDNGLHAKQSAQWFWEYNRIFELIEMIHDYNNIMRDVLKGANENE